MSKVVKIADKEYTVQRFRGLKAVLVIASMTKIAREVPDILADTVKVYQERNTIAVTEAMSKLPRWEGFSKEDFDAAEAATGKRVLELPLPMTQNEQLLQALPDLLAKARREVVHLLAILIIPNEELKAADKADRVDEELEKYNDVLMYEAELDELIDLALTAQDVLTDQLKDRGDRLGKLGGQLFRMLRPGTPALPSMTPMPSTTVETPMSQDEKLTSPTSTDSAPPSSTDSEQPMAGTETPRSTESLGVS